MHDDFITLVLKIRKDHGESALLAPTRLRALLSDYAAGSHRGAIRIFLLALEEGFVARLHKEDNPSEAFLRTQASLFADSFGLTEKTGESIVWCWAEALGLSIAGRQVTLEHMPSPVTPSGTGVTAKTPSQPQSMRPSSPDAARLQVYNNSIGIEFILIPGGSFMMGSDENRDKEAYPPETPAHRVHISKSFYLGKYAVTQPQFEAIMSGNPGYLTGPNRPVEEVSWYDAQEFIRKLNYKEGHNRYRLPTEAEWEYAARAGTESVYHFGDDAAQLERYAWYGKNSGSTTHPVGQKNPNPWGLYDIYGNVCEWVLDWYENDHYQHTPSTDPGGPSMGLYRVLRGGLCGDSAKRCRSAHRRYNSPDRQSYHVGFRLALSTGQ